MKRRILSLLLSVVLVVPCAAPAEALSETVFQKSDLSLSMKDLQDNDSEGKAHYRENEGVQVIVELEACRDDGQEAVTNLRENVLAAIAHLMGREELTADYVYTWVVNGFAVTIPREIMDAVAALDGVECVHQAARYEGLTSPVSVEESTGIADFRVLVGADKAQELGYDGSGVLVAVIDTGIDPAHPAFSGEMSGASCVLSTEILSEKLGQLNAASLCKELTVEEVYHSDKIPFGFNYADGNTDITHDNDSAGDHGTHVAGILAANGGESAMDGIAPGAQLLIMKVFGQQEQDASEAALVAAVEDAVALGADVINMSLGGTVGFSHEGTTLARAIKCAMAQGVTVCAAAGNAYSGAFGNLSGTNLSQTDRVDVGVIASPASLKGVLTVAGVESGVNFSRGFFAGQAEEGQFVPMSDTGSQFGLALFESLADIPGHENEMFEFVCVPGAGRAEDYNELPLTGAVALVQRGEITFAEKCENAFRAGAVAVVIYNHNEETVQMDLTGISTENTIPCVFVSMEAGELLCDLAGENGKGVLTVYRGVYPVLTGEQGVPSAFSSWGGGSDLSLKPELSAVGGNVYSAVNNGGYAAMSGTSMAAPQVSGAMAVMLQYLEESLQLTGTQAGDLAGTLLMNTADPALQENGVEYSPRKQGAGLLDLEGALNSGVVARVKENDLPKAELGSDSSGRYTFTLTLDNFSDGEQSYLTNASVLTECAEDGLLIQSARRVRTEVTVTDNYGAEVYFYDLNGDHTVDVKDEETLRRMLSSGENVDFDVNGDGFTDDADAHLFAEALAGRAEVPGGTGRLAVTVPPGGSITLTVNVRLTDEERESLFAEFENGVYVEGYFMLESTYGGEDLSIPMLGFLGDWSAGPLFETTSRSEIEAESWDGEGGNSPVPFTVFTGADSYLGMNPVGGETACRAERSNALNASGSEGGVIYEVYLDLLRNARRVTIEAVSGRGEVLYRSEAKNVSRSCYSDTYGQLVPVVWSTQDESFFFDPVASGMAAGESGLLRITGWKDCTVGGAVTETVEIPFYLDGEEPVLLNVETARGDSLRDGCTVTLTVRDDFYVAGVLLLTADGENVLEKRVADQSARGEDVRLTFDLTEYIQTNGGQFVLAVVDYAQNMGLYDLCLLEEGETTLFDEGTLIAFLEGEGWYTSLPGQPEGFVVGFRNYLGAVSAAQAVGDTLFVTSDDVTDTLYAVDCGTFLPKETFDLELEPYTDEVLDLAWCDGEECLYLLVRRGEKCRILRADLRTERTETVCRDLVGAYAIACDGSGALWLISGEREARASIVDCESGKPGAAAELGIALENSVISAEWDAEKGALFLAVYCCTYNYDNGTVQNAQTMLYTWGGMGKAQPVMALGGSPCRALTIADSGEKRFSPDDPATALCLNETDLTLVPGRRVQLDASAYRPWYVSGAGYDLSFESGDPQVARVSDTGLLLAVGPGETEITVTARRGDEETVAACCHVRVYADSSFFALRGGAWIEMTTGTMAEKTAPWCLTTQADAAAFGKGAGPEGQDVIYVVSHEMMEKNPVCTLLTYDSGDGTLLAERPLTNLWANLGGELPEKGFADLAYDPVLGLLLGVAGQNCYSIDPVNAEVRRVYTVSACPEGRSLLGVTFDGAGTAYLVDSAAVLYRLEGYYVSTAVCTVVSELGLSSSARTGKLEYDALRNTLCLLWGRGMYVIDPEAPVVRAGWMGWLGEDVKCLLMPRY